MDELKTKRDLLDFFDAEGRQVMDEVKTKRELLGFFDAAREYWDYSQTKTRWPGFVFPVVLSFYSDSVSVTIDDTEYRLCDATDEIRRQMRRPKPAAEKLIADIRAYVEQTDDEYWDELYMELVQDVIDWDAVEKGEASDE